MIHINYIIIISSCITENRTYLILVLPLPWPIWPCHYDQYQNILLTWAFKFHDELCDAHAIYFGNKIDGQTFYHYECTRV